MTLKDLALHPLIMMDNTTTGARAVLDGDALEPRTIPPRNLRLGVYRGGRRPIPLAAGAVARNCVLRLYAAGDNLALGNPSQFYTEQHAWLAQFALVSSKPGQAV